MPNSLKPSLANILILGDGQLARMLKQAAEPLGIHVIPIGESSPLSLEELKVLVTTPCVITAEIERWPDTPLTQFLSVQPHFINQSVFGLLADRYTQKSLLDKLELKTAPWCLLPEYSEWPKLFTTLNEKLVIKTRVGGYDGRGQWRVTAENISQALPIELTGQAIAESMIPFEYEVSLVGARNRHGQKVFYPLTRNFHQEGILRASIAFGDVNLSKDEATERIKNKTDDPLRVLQNEAESMLGTLLDHLDYVGVLAMECFVINTDHGPQLLINELAPRVHNSGHWTQNGASISQFELHIRAICDLPLPSPSIFPSSIMLNLIGSPLNYQWINDPLIHLHWYDKAPREGRKLGHLNISSSNHEAMVNALNTLPPYLTEDYQPALSWLKSHLTK